MTPMHNAWPRPRTRPNPNPKPRRTYTAKEVKRMRELRRAGYSIAAVAALMDVNWNSVYYHIRDIPPPPGGWHRGGAGKKGLPS